MSEKKADVEIKDLNDVNMVEGLLAQKKVVIVGFFKDESSESVLHFIEVANEFHNYTFGICQNIDKYAKYQVKYDSVIMFKPYDDKINVFHGELTEENLKKFIYLYSLPLFIEYSKIPIKHLQECGVNVRLIIFISKDSGHLERYIEPLRDLAIEYRSKILFQIVDINEKHVFDFWCEILGVDRDKLPELRLFKMEKSKNAKYKPESNNLSPESVKQFLESYFLGKLKEFLLCEKRPPDWNKNPVKILVCSNFNEVVLDKTKNVLVIFYTPNCFACMSVEQDIIKLGEKYKKSDNIIIAKINVEKNEFENMKFTYLPQLKLYRKGDNKIIEYDMKNFNFDNCIKFIENGGNTDGRIHNEESLKTERKEPQRGPRKSDEENKNMGAYPKLKRKK